MASRPGGTVSFFVDGSATAAATVALADGHASFTATFRDGTHIVVAAYNGDANFAPSASSPATIRLPGTTTTTPGSTGAGPPLALTGQDATIALTAAAGLLILALGARQLRRRVDRLDRGA